MPGENSQNSNTNDQGSANANTDANSNTTANQNTDSQSNDTDKGEKSIPYSRFAEVNQKFRETEKELANYKAKEKAESEAKLLEEKKFQDLIENKSKEIETLKAENNQIKLNAKKEKIEFKVSSTLAKNNIIDPKDGLKFLDYSDLIDSSDDIDNKIEERVADLVKNKAYLFKAGSGSTRSNTENNVPGNQQKPDDANQGKGKNARQNIELSIAEKLKF